MPINIYKKNNNFYLRYNDGFKVKKPLDVTQHPVDTQVYVLNDGTRASAVFFVDIDPFSFVRSYSWQLSRDNGVSYTDIPYQNTSFLILNDITISDNNNKYRCIIAFDGMTIISLPATIGVSYVNSEDPGIQILNHPVDTLIDNQTASFSVFATSDSNLFYQWQISDNLGLSFTDIEGATSSTLYLNNLTRRNHDNVVRVRVYSEANPEGVISNEAYIIGIVQLKFVINPISAIADSQGNASFFSQVAPIRNINLLSVSIQYQWQVSRDNGTSWDNIDGQTDQSIYLSDLTPSDNESLYRVIATSSCCGLEETSTTSSSAPLYVYAGGLVFVVQPSDISTYDVEATFSCEVRSSCPYCGWISFQWCYVTGTDDDPIYTPIDGPYPNGFSSFTVNVIDNDKKKFAVIATQSNTDYVVISNTVTLNNLNNKPTNISLSNTFILENNNIGEVIGTFRTEDLDTDSIFTYSFTDYSYNDNYSFNINGNELIASSYFSFDFKNTYTIKVRSQDQFGVYLDKVFTIRVRRIPTLSLENVISQLPENANTSSAISVANIRITNPIDNNFILSEQDLLLFGPDSLSLSGVDSEFFYIDGLKVKLKSAVVFDRQLKENYSIQINLRDLFSSSSLNTSYNLSLTESQLGPTEITLSNSSIQENNALLQEIGVLNSIDLDINETFTYSLVSGSGDTDNSSFVIENDRLKANAIFDADTKNLYSIRVRSTDQSNLFYEKNLTINIVKITEPQPDPVTSLPPSYNPGIGFGDPHYAISAIKGNRVTRLANIIDDNIGGGPVIAAYVKLHTEEWKAVVTNTPGIVCAIDRIDFYYRNGSQNWSTINMQTFNNNGCFIFKDLRTYFAEFTLENIDYAAVHNDLRIGGFLYWLQKAVELSNQRVRISVQRDDVSWLVGVDGITLATAKFGLHRNDFLASAGDSKLTKISEKFNLFSQEMASQ